jgi:hypothetical protein
MGSMKSMFVRHIAASLLAVCVVTMVAIPLSFFLVAMWVDKHRLSWMRRNRSFTYTAGNLNGS